ncbi:LuxR C-terminal-related transcriptional regulator [Microtetraspora sp. NBRC 16547]|uniref:helix-turn-helix transcriptional regulator n=1 Tax=Microtetraspora sp. NBRC 16547 TaxID=3030993 RepID=UPI0024A33AB1|nr:LuxR C-terminal-related transcriptional regulator [Microtetraspora sp. NBRC 16547]GLW99104.1 helix-turn-helix transcriptional regulator [Microtetraspora sp. NBRC 16547]
MVRLDGETPPDIPHLWGQELRSLREATGAPIAFGGPVVDGRLCLAHFDGTRTRLLSGLAVSPGAGVGGRAWGERRVVGVDDYRIADDISHDYDFPVLTEGIRATVAAPVLVGTTVRGVIYSAVRESPGLGDRLKTATTVAARVLARKLAVEDEIERRVAAHVESVDRLHASALERLRKVHSGLHALRQSTVDGVVRERISDLLEELSGEAAGNAAGKAAGNAAENVPALRARELAVLSMVATGRTYASVAAELGIAPMTVKSYMRDILVRLDVHSRHEAVVAARRHGLLP